MIYYELKKIWGNAKNIKFFIFLCVLLSIVTGYQAITGKLSPAVYKDVHSKLDQMNINDAQAFLNEKKDAYEFHSYYYLMQNSSQFLQKYRNIYGNEWVKAQIQAIDNSQTTNPAQLNVYQSVLDEVKSIKDYGNYRDSIRKRYEERSEISLFQSDSSIQNMINKKTYEQYAHLHTGTLHLQPELALQNTMTSKAADILLLLLLIYLTFVNILQEKENHMLRYTQSMKLGRRHQVLTRYIAIASTLICFTVLFYIGIYVINALLFGNANLQVPVQSFSFLSTCPYAISAFTFLILTLFLRILAMLCITALISFIAYICRMVSTFIISLICLTFLFSFLHIFNSGFLNLQYWDILLYLHPEQLLMHYDFINYQLFSIPALYAIGTLPIITVLFLYLSRTCIYRCEVQQRKPILKMRKPHPHLLYFYEWKKVLFKQKGLILCLIAIVTFSYYLAGIHDVSTPTDYVYNMFVDSIGAHVSKQSDAKIKSQEHYYQQIQNELNKETDVNKQNNLTQKLSTLDGFQMYQRAYDARSKSDRHRKILKEDQYRLLYYDSNVSKVMVTCFLFICMYLLYENTQYEKRTKMNIIQCSTLQKYQIHVDKQRVLWICCCLLLLILQVLLWIRNFMFYPHLNINENIQCLNAYFHFPIPLPIWVYLFVVMLWQCFVIYVLVYIGRIFVTKLRTPYLFMMLFFILCIIPIWFETPFALLYWLLYPHAMLHNNLMIYMLPCMIIVSLLLNSLHKRVWHAVAKQ